MIDLDQLEIRVAALEEAPITTKLDHAGLFVVAGDGLRGGGTIDKRISLSLAINELTEGAPRRGDESVPFYDPETRQQFKVSLRVLAKRVIAESDFEERLAKLEKAVEQVEYLVGLLSVYERLHTLEQIVLKGASRK